MNNLEINQYISNFTESPLVIDYCNDLNAIHEAERHLNIDQEYNYGEELRKVSENIGPRGGHFTPNGWGCFSLAHLNAHQKAQALVITITNTQTLGA
jgi:hypothetical protein